MKINYFIFVTGILYTGATIMEVIRGNYTLAIVYGCYAMSGFALSTL